MQDRFLFMLSKIQKKLSSHIRRKLKEQGVVLSPGQMGILLALENEKQTTMGELSRILEIDNAAITRLVDKLEKLDYVERQINLKDRRQMLITITSSGMASASIVKTIVQSANNKIKEGFTKEEIDIYKRVNVSLLDKF